MYKIVWGHTAEKDYLSTLDFWITNNQSSNYSLKLMDEVEKIEDYIVLNPFMGTPIDMYPSVRKMQVMQHYSLIYKIDEHILHIIAFWDNRRNPADLII
ncbi:MAG: type II toxin-antitoxin system RelE/ParE family toxin [Bacteroidia bacterium]|nr:type II toxin-antitoxin system RelE/ParE family toxin [Bacteroidia bacterium]